MNYIVLDMEWNQPGFTDKTLCRNGVCMNNEIIQIGAVKLDEDLKSVDTFEVIIKPKSITSMNKMITRLTGITDEMLEDGVDFEEAMKEFSSWCADDFVFLIWGYDDIRILKNNLKFYGIDMSWLGKSYNLQMIFCSQNNLEHRQYSLSFALEFFGITVNAELHDALNDAQYTAMICARLDVASGIETLDKSQSGNKDSDKKAGELIKRKFKHIRRKEDIWQNGFIVRPVCPYCNEKMKFKKPVPSGTFRYNIEGLCENHGSFMVVVRMSKTPEETFSVSQQIFTLDEKTRGYFENKQKNHRKRVARRSSRSKKQEIKSNEKEVSKV